MQRDCVTTIIPVFNRATMLCEAVQSVLQQSWRPIEIIIVDDGSTDDTAEVADRLASGHPDVIRVLHVANGGPGRAREHGRQAARGEFLQYLDSDDRLLPDKFACQVQALRSHPDCGVAYGKTRLVDEQGRVLQAPFKLTGERLDTLFPALLVDRWWNTHTPLYRRSLCHEVGSWSDMRMGEDWDYDARVGATGTRLAFCDEFVSETRQHRQPRLTGAGDLTTGMLSDFGRLVPVLYRSALQAGVSRGCPEMQHLSRWAFSLARQLGRIGNEEQAVRCFAIARDSDCHGGASAEYLLFELLARAVGWRGVGRVSRLVDGLRRNRAGKLTLKQSWMTN